MLGYTATNKDSNNQNSAWYGEVLTENKLVKKKQIIDNIGTYSTSERSTTSATVD